MDKKCYGLILPKKNKKVYPTVKSVFDSESENDESENVKKGAQCATKKKTLQQKLIAEDPTIYEYDSIYDNMKANETKKTIETKKNKPLYITSLLKAADKRKLEHGRRLEKKIQSERSKEGDELKDRDAYVTSSYRKKMLELEEEKERELREGQLEEMMDVTKQKDLSGFYRHFLKQTIGEEKVPEFGARYTKKEDMPVQIKTEPSETKSKPTHSSHVSSPEHSSKFESIPSQSSKITLSKEQNSKQLQKNFRRRTEDSDSDSNSSNDQEHISRAISKHREKYNYKASTQSRDENEKSEVCSLSSNKSHWDRTSRKGKKSFHSSDKKHNTDSDEPISPEKRPKTVVEDVTESKKVVALDNPAMKEEKLSDSVKYNPGDDDDYDSSDSEQNVSDDKTQQDSKTLEKEKVQNVKQDKSAKLVKYNVGIIFDQAQARYFERKAAMNLTKRKK